MGVVTRKQADAIFRRNNKVSRLRQWWFGSSFSRYDYRPCPRCHGNDRVVDVAEAPGFTQYHCLRCDRTYIG